MSARRRSGLALNKELSQKVKPRWSKRRWFHTGRLIFWLAQIPFAVSIEAIRESVPYLVFLSLAALVESSATDVDNARAAENRGEEEIHS